MVILYRPQCLTLASCELTRWMMKARELQSKDVAQRPAQIIPHPFCINAARDSGAGAVSVLWRNV